MFLLNRVLNQLPTQLLAAFALEVGGTFVVLGDTVQAAEVYSAESAWEPQNTSLSGAEIAFIGLYLENLGVASFQSYLNLFILFIRTLSIFQLYFWVIERSHHEFLEIILPLGNWGNSKKSGQLIHLSIFLIFYCDRAGLRIWVFVAIDLLLLDHDIWKGGGIKKIWLCFLQFDFGGLALFFVVAGGT